jgi:hypothetical protein
VVAAAVESGIFSFNSGQHFTLGYLAALIDIADLPCGFERELSEASTKFLILARLYPVAD